MKIRDKDGYLGEVKDAYDSGRGFLVDVTADGLWLTPGQATRFAAAFFGDDDAITCERPDGHEGAHASGRRHWQ